MVKSMTGYGRARETRNGRDITVEVRSVNNRYLDCAVKMPRAYIFAEDAVKSLVQKHVSRGKVDVFVSIDSLGAEETVVAVNDALAKSYIDALRHLSQLGGGMVKEDCYVTDLARLPDVLTVTKADEDLTVVSADICAVLEEALRAHAAMRETEGKKLTEDIRRRVDTIAALTRLVEERSPQTVAEYRQKLLDRMREVLQSTAADEGRILTEADVIAVPDKGTGEKTALSIIGPLAEGKPLLYCAAPMTRDPDCLEAAYEQNARQIAALLDEGKTVAFITLGDPSIYSTYLYTHRKVLAMGYEGKLIPGVPSFCAVAAALGGGLCEGSERLMIVPASHKDVSDCLAVDANYIFMKAGREIGRLRDTLAEQGLLDHAAMVENCGMETERVFPRFAEAPADSGYFSVVVVKRDGN